MGQLIQHCRIVDIPGTPGDDGAAGAGGAAGSNAWASLTAPFTMPDYGLTTFGGTACPLILDHTDWLAPGEPLFVERVGTVIVVSISGLIVTVQNPADGSAEYPSNAAPGTIVATTLRVTPTGFDGATGTVAGVAGGDLTGNYPDPALKNTGTPGTYGDATHVPVVTTDAAGRVTAVTPTAITFPSSGTPSGAAGGDLAGTYPNPTLGTSGVAAGTYGSEALIPQLAIDAKGRATSVSNKQPRYGLLGSLTAADFNVVTDQAISINSTKYRVDKILVTNASVNLTTAQGGVYNAAGKPGGGVIVDATQAYTALTASSKFVALTLAGVALTDVQTSGFLYLSLTTPQGVAATASVYVFGEHLG